MSYIKCMSNDVYDKCLRVIDSCEKIDQLDVARNYIDFYYERYRNTKEYSQLFYHYTIKRIELEKK